MKNNEKKNSEYCNKLIPTTDVGAVVPKIYF